MRGVRIRPLEPTDHEPLKPLDAALGGPVRLTRAAASFYARSGHAFVAEGEGGPCGLALAQAVWDGTRGTLRIVRLGAVPPDAAAVRAALLDAVTKSAYDAAVYDLTIEAPENDVDLLDLLSRERWRPDPVRVLRRTLGSRGAAPEEGP